MARPLARYAGTLYTPGSSVAAISGSTAQVNGDRKSTRLNSSHSQISYAVFCLNKKKHNAAGFVSLSHKGTDDDFVPDLTPAERAIVYATQGPWNSACLADNVSVPAWTTKPSWY